MALRRPRLRLRADLQRRVQAVGRDCTQEILARGSQVGRALVEHAPDAIVVLDVDAGKFTDANDKACELFNLSRQRLLLVGPEAMSPEKQPDGTPSFGIRRGLVDRALAGEHPTTAGSSASASPISPSASATKRCHTHKTRFSK